jgi:hypothetical protein
MEINLALLLMAAGLAGIFSLFPVGMRQRNASSADTTQAAFATKIFHGMRGNAQLITNWNDWLVMTNGINFGLTSGSTTPAGGTVILTPDNITASFPSLSAQVNNYPGAGQTLRLKISLELDASHPRIITAVLQSTTRQFTDITREPKYATSFFYLGM